MKVISGPLQAQIRTDGAGQPDQRRAHRRVLQLSVPAVSSGGSADALVHDLSETGLLLQTSAALKVGELLYVDLPEAGVTKALVIWAQGRFFGCEFIDPVSKASVSAALLRSPRATYVAAEDSDVGAADQQSWPLTEPWLDDQTGMQWRALAKPVALAAAILAAPLGLIAFAGGLTALLIAIAILSVLATLLIAWGTWIENNVR